MKKIKVIAICVVLMVSATIKTVAACVIPDSHIVAVEGKFYTKCELMDAYGNRDIYYQFRSDDNSTWWLLTEKEIGFVPQTLENVSKSVITGGIAIDSADKLWSSYILTYDNNGTTSENKPCDCPPEDECECEVYNDTFIHIKAVAREEK